VSYKIKFYKPIDEFSEQDPTTAHYCQKTGISTVAADPFGTDADHFKQISPPGFDLTWVTPTTVAFPSYVKEGKWLLLYKLTSTGAATATTMSLAGAGWASIYAWQTSGGVPSGDVTANAPLSGGSTQSGMVARLINVTAAGPTITAAVTHANNFYWDLFVLPVDVDLVGLAENKRAWMRARRRGMEDSALEERKAISQIEMEMAALRSQLERALGEEKDQGTVPRGPIVEPEDDTGTDCCGRRDNACARALAVVRAEIAGEERDDASEDAVLLSPVKARPARPVHGRM
jgi:hypothetical protein